VIAGLAAVALLAAAIVTAQVGLPPRLPNR